MTTTLTAARQWVVEKYGLGLVLANSLIGSVSASALVSTNYFQNSNLSQTEYSKKNTLIHRPGAATAADYVRPAGDLTASTGSLANVGAVWSDTTIGSENPELLFFGLRPDLHYLKAINRAQTFCGARGLFPLTLAPDGDMNESGVTSWGSASSASAAKQATASRVFSAGRRSIAVTNSGANGYLPTANIPVTPGHMMLIWAIGRLQSGTSAQLTLYDATNAAVFGETRSTSASRHQYLWQQVGVPTGCYNINVRLGGSGASDVSDWSALGVVDLDDMRMNLQTTIEERHEFEALTIARFDRNNGSGVEEAASIVSLEISETDYSVSAYPSAANTMNIQFHGQGRRWLGYPLFIQARTPDFDLVPLAVESDVSSVPLHLLGPAAAMRLLSAEGGHIADAAVKYAMAETDWKAATTVRTVEGPAQRRQVYVYHSVSG